MNKNILGYVGVALAVGLLILAGSFFSKTEVITQTITPTSQQLQELMQQNLGSLTGPDIMSSYLSVNGVKTYYTHFPLRVATTTTNDTGNSVARVICSIPTPAATTTLISMSVSFTTGTTTASIVDIAEAANSYATTTKLGATYILAANAKGDILATTTSAVSGGQAGLIAPSQYLNVKMAGGIGTYSPVGSCQAVLRGI